MASATRACRARRRGRDPAKARAAGERDGHDRSAQPSTGWRRPARPRARRGSRRTPVGAGDPARGMPCGPTVGHAGRQHAECLPEQFCASDCFACPARTQARRASSSMGKSGVFAQVGDRESGAVEDSRTARRWKPPRSGGAHDREWCGARSRPWRTMANAWTGLLEDRGKTRRSRSRAPARPSVGRGDRDARAVRRLDEAAPDHVGENGAS